jgi:hypothetical protein
MSADSLLSGKTKRPDSYAGLSVCQRCNTYAAEMAFTGQVSTHAPQSMQVSASMLCLVSPALIAFTGQESAHAPQLMHSSEIL